MAERLDKLISGATEYSRKEARALIRDGRVRVADAVITLPEHLCAPGEYLTLDGSPLTLPGEKFYMLNKPAGILCATSDSRERTVIELIPANLRKNLFPAGRLDKDTTGFVLLTDDGAFAHRLLSPKSHVPKEYHVTLDKAPDLVMLRDEFSRPLDLGGGDVTSPAVLTALDGFVVSLVIFEGVYHQVKRMFGKFRYKVEELRRVRIGGLFLDQSLPAGGFRALTLAERESLLSEKGEES